MESVNRLFLQALQASLNGKTVAWEEELTLEQWNTLFAMAMEHHVLPMIYEAVSHCPAARKTDDRILISAKRQTMQQVMLQAVRTDAFLKLLPELVCAGVTPLVVKGIVCRQLYPNPDCRISGDEDVLIPENRFTLCHEAMLKQAMALLDPEADLNAFEVSYGEDRSHLHIELHKQLFSPESDAYGEFNRFFEGAQDRAITHTIQGVPVTAMGHTDHLFYLICHSFKHFLHSGFGIRQVCDLCLYANAYGAEIDWNIIQTQCKEIHADIFTAALFRIGEKYLTFQPEEACYPEQWRMMAIDETAMLEDLLSSGVFGASSMSRKHSSNMTLHAVSAGKQGKKTGGAVLKALFPSAKNLSGRYPYLKEKPYLLPVAWTDRILKYGKETAAPGQGNSAAESLRIGNERIELLKQYGIIER